ncbi:hypothetical protein [Aquisphaera insulae]|uniref:hypothetical protein n=1 Tax=Aquisphaera insulae TaxID=2712864 RepID=UPI0013E9B8EB|nr:hypothetical protein [Aquisphaera insulae]
MKRFSMLVVSASMFVGSCGLVRADLLPAAPPPGFTLQDINNQVDPSIKLKINAYTSKVVDFEKDVICPDDGAKIGTIKFQYTTYTGDFSGGNKNDFGGALINGGFIAGPDACPIGPDTTYRWLQDIVVTGDETTRKIDGDPFYTDFTMKGYTATLFDAPGRGTLGTDYKDLRWLAESALVCVTGKTVKTIGSFLWGFTITTNNAGVTSVNPIEPGFWSPGSTQSLKDQFLKEYKDKGYTIADGCCCVPEPASIILSGIAMVLVVSVRGRLVGRHHAS